MAGRLQRELKQHRGFPSSAVEASLSIQRTADLLHRRLCQVLRPEDLSPAQYNVLRILRGAARARPDAPGLPCREIAARLLTWDPDVTRLTDRLVARGLALRDRLRGDRRVVLVAITSLGQEVLARLDAPVAACDAGGLDSLGEARLRTLIDTLDAIRDQLDPEPAASTTSLPETP